MNDVCCNNNCNQGRNCPLRNRKEYVVDFLTTTGDEDRSFVSALSVEEAESVVSKYDDFVEVLSVREMK